MKSSTWENARYDCSKSKTKILNFLKPRSTQECSGHTRTEVYVSHVANIAKYVRSTWKGVQPIIWDDMLRNMLTEEMRPLAGLVQPMVWVYAEDIYRFVPTFTWDRLSEVFDTAWTASAFKGAHGPTLTFPNTKRHLDNNLNWIDLMRNEEEKFANGFQGIVITGWQRYKKLLFSVWTVSIICFYLTLVVVVGGKLLLNGSLIPLSREGRGVTPHPEIVVGDSDSCSK